MSDEKEVVNADEYAAMRKELVVMRTALDLCLCRLSKSTCHCQICTTGRKALASCPIAAELSKQEPMENK